MTLFHARWSCVFVLALAAGGQGSVLAADQAMSAGIVFEGMGSDYCEPVPPGMADEEVEAVYAQAIEDDAASLRGHMQGFMEGERIGVSVFGTRTPDAGLAVVSSVMGPLPAGGHASMCLVMIQLGDVPAAPGTYDVTGIPGLDAATPGDVLVVGRVLQLEPTGRKGDTGRDIYRLANLGEADVRQCGQLRGQLRDVRFHS